MNRFNVRVYGILLNDKQEVLISDEREYGMEFSKFPGGGLEFGEGLIEGLQREFMEECQLPVDIIQHIHTTDRFLKSAFDDSQVIGVYYLVRSDGRLSCRIGKRPFDFDSDTEPNQVFRWINIHHLHPETLTFEMDRIAWQAFLATKKP